MGIDRTRDLGILIFSNRGGRNAVYPGGEIYQVIQAVANGL